MRIRPISVLVTAAAAMLVLAGCSFTAEAGPSVSASKVAATAAKALAAKVGSTPKIDCGSDDIILVKGKKITCELTDTDGLIYDVAVTFTSVSGSTYNIDVKVANTAKNAPSPTVSSGSGDAPTVPGTDIAQLAAGALESQLGFAPDISCADDVVPIVVGGTEACGFTDPSGTAHDVTVTITEFDGSNYSIDAKVIN